MQDLLARQRASWIEEGSASLPVRRDRLARLHNMISGHRDAWCAAVLADLGGAGAAHAVVSSDLLMCMRAIENDRAQVGSWMRARRLWPNFPFGRLTDARVVRSAKGVVGIVEPCTRSMVLAFAPVSAALAAGNRVMIKTPHAMVRTSDMLATLAKRYFAETELAVVAGGPKSEMAFCALGVDHLHFGLAKTASALGSRAVSSEPPQPARHSANAAFTGRSPVIIGRTADLDLAARRIARSKLDTPVQAAPDLVFAHVDIHNAFVAKLMAAHDEAYIAIARRSGTGGGRLSAADHARLYDLVDDAYRKGAVVVRSSAAWRGVEPLRPLDILTNVTNTMRVLDEKILGPVLPIRRFAVIDEVLAQVNRDRPGALYYFGRDATEEALLLSGTSSEAFVLDDVEYDEDVTQSERQDAGSSGSCLGRAGFEAFTYARGIYRRTGARELSGARSLVSMKSVEIDDFHAISIMWPTISDRS